MPATFDAFGLRFMYPDNWKVVDRAEDEGDNGVTLELPSGGFFSIEQLQQGQREDDVFEAVARSIEEEYGEVERDDVATTDGSTTVDFQFYYLDLLIVSRTKIVDIGATTLCIQMQAESRDFEENQLVFEAILKQIQP